MELIFRRKHKRNHNADIYFNLKTGENYGITAIGKASAPSIYNLPQHLVADYFDIEQYTGVEAKNGQRIFDGDRITGKTEFGFLNEDGSLSYRPEKVTGIVYWDCDEARFAVDLGEDCIEPEWVDDWKEIEVIGHIRKGAI